MLPVGWELIPLSQLFHLLCSSTSFMFFYTNRRNMLPCCSFLHGCFHAASNEMGWSYCRVCSTAVQMLKTTKTLWEIFLHKFVATFVENKTFYIPYVIYLFIYSFNFTPFNCLWRFYHFTVVSFCSLPGFWLGPQVLF